MSPEFSRTVILALHLKSSSALLARNSWVRGSHIQKNKWSKTGTLVCRFHIICNDASSLVFSPNLYSSPAVVLFLNQNVLGYNDYSESTITSFFFFFFFAPFWLTLHSTPILTGSSGKKEVMVNFVISAFLEFCFNMENVVMIGLLEIKVHSLKERYINVRRVPKVYSAQRFPGL